MKTIQIDGQDYVTVNERIKYFRGHFPGWSIITEIVNLEKDNVVMRCVIKDPFNKIRATGTARENQGDNTLYSNSYIEGCETSCIGRALGILGIGIDSQVCSADEKINCDQKELKKKYPDAEQCERCGEILMDFNFLENDVEKSLSFASKETFGKKLCFRCYKEMSDSNERTNNG